MYLQTQYTPHINIFVQNMWGLYLAKFIFFHPPEFNENHIWTLTFTCWGRGSQASDLVGVFLKQRVDKPHMKFFTLCIHYGVTMDKEGLYKQAGRLTEPSTWCMLLVVAYVWYFWIWHWVAFHGAHRKKVVFMYFLYSTKQSHNNNPFSRWWTQ